MHHSDAKREHFPGSTPLPALHPNLRVSFITAVGNSDSGAAPPAAALVPLVTPLEIVGGGERRRRNCPARLGPTRAHLTRTARQRPLLFRRDRRRAPGRLRTNHGTNPAVLQQGPAAGPLKQRQPGCDR